MVTPRALLDLFVGDVEGRRVGVLPVVFGGARRLRGVVRGLLGGLARGGRLGRFGVRFRRRREATSIRTEGAPRHRGGVPGRARRGACGGGLPFAPTTLLLFRALHHLDLRDGLVFGLGRGRSRGRCVRADHGREPATSFRTGRARRGCGGTRGARRRLVVLRGGLDVGVRR